MQINGNVIKLPINHNIVLYWKHKILHWFGLCFRTNTVDCNVRWRWKLPAFFVPALHHPRQRICKKISGTPVLNITFQSNFIQLDFTCSLTVFTLQTSYLTKSKIDFYLRLARKVDLTIQLEERGWCCTVHNNYHKPLFVNGGANEFTLYCLIKFQPDNWVQARLGLRPANFHAPYFRLHYVSGIDDAKPCTWNLNCVLDIFRHLNRVVEVLNQLACNLVPVLLKIILEF